MYECKIIKKSVKIDCKYLCLSLILIIMAEIWVAAGATFKINGNIHSDKFQYTKAGQKYNRKSQKNQRDGHWSGQNSHKKQMEQGFVKKLSEEANPAQTTASRRRSLADLGIQKQVTNVNNREQAAKPQTKQLTPPPAGPLKNQTPLQTGGTSPGQETKVSANLVYSNSIMVYEQNSGYFSPAAMSSTAPIIFYGYPVSPVYHTVPVTPYSYPALTMPSTQAYPHSNSYSYPYLPAYPANPPPIQPTKQPQLLSQARTPTPTPTASSAAPKSLDQGVTINLINKIFVSPIPAPRPTADSSRLLVSQSDQTTQTKKANLTASTTNDAVNRTQSASNSTIKNSSVMVVGRSPTSLTATPTPAVSKVPSSASSQLAQNPQMKLLYQQYLANYKGTPQDKTPAELSVFRQTTLNTNINTIIQHNETPNRTYTMGLNTFTDLSSAQYAGQLLSNQYLGELSKLVVPDSLKKLAAVEIAAQASVGQHLPNKPPRVYVDWSCKATPAISQGACGACYVIAAVESIQITHAIYGMQYEPLSIQEVISCAKHGAYENGCVNGYFYQTYNYAMNNGIGWAALYSYNEQAKFQQFASQCNYTALSNPSYTQNKAFIKDSISIRYGDCQQLVRQLQFRAIAVSIAAANLQFYTDGIFTTDNQNINHGVTLVGYDPVREAFLIKNSWGKGWGDQGFGFVDATTGVCNYAMYPILDKEHKIVPQCQNGRIKRQVPTG